MLKEEPGPSKDNFSWWKRLGLPNECRRIQMEARKFCEGADVNEGLERKLDF